MLDSNRMNGAPRARFSKGNAKKRSLLVVALNQMNPTIIEFGQTDCSDNARKSATAPQIDPLFRTRMDLENLNAIGDVPFPQMLFG